MRWRVALLAVAGLALWAGVLQSAAPRDGAPAAVAAGQRLRAVPAQLATSPGGAGPAVVVVVPGLTLADLGRWRQRPRPELAGAAWALVTPATGGGPQPWPAYATLAAGAPAAAGEEAGWAFDALEPVPGRTAAAGELWRRLGGEDRGGAAVVHLGLAAVRQRSAAEARRPALGALADALALEGRSTAAFGNADVHGRRQRGGALLAADAVGRVRYGRVGTGVLRPDAALPAGVVTDWDAVLAAVAGLPSEVALVVVEAGDLWRLDADRALLTPERYEALRARLLDELGAALATLADWARGRRGLVLAVAPGPPPAARGAGFGVAMAWYPDRDGEDVWLASPSTRRAGLVALADLVPTLAAWLDVPAPPGSVGRPLFRVAAAGDAPDDLLRLEAALLDNHQRRGSLLRGYVLAEIGLLVWAAWALRGGGGARLLRPALVASTLLPTAYLILPLVPVRGTAAAAAVAVIAVAAGTAALLRLPGPPYLAYVASAAVAVGAVAADLALGGPWAPRSPMGYSLLGGARFYGLGNEYEGVLLGAGLLWAGGLAQAAGLGRRVGAAALALLASPLPVLAGAPALGADFGGAVAAAAGLGVAVADAAGVALRRAGVLALACGLAAGVAAFAGDGAAGGGGTHLALLLRRLGEGGWPTLAEVAVRKMELNLRLIRYTVWSRVLLALLAVLALVVFGAATARGPLARRPLLRAALQGAVAAGLVALVINDSGVVAAATALVFPVAVLVDLALAEEARPPGVLRVDTPGGGLYNESGLRGAGG